MIVLGKNFGNYDYTRMLPIGIVEKNKIKLVVDKNIIEIFPNNGKIFIPSIYQKITTGNFMLYQLEMSNKYEINNANSSYYTVTQLRTDLPFFEVHDLSESYGNDAEKIVEKILFGFPNKVEPLPDIILRTSDDYLIGPFKSRYDFENQHVHIRNDFESEKFLIPIYNNRQQQIEITFYSDEFEDIERAFTITRPESKDIIDKLDVGSEDYVVREAIKFLKGNEEFGDITRRVTRSINEWLKGVTFSEDHNTRRLKKAVQLIEQITPESEDYRAYTTYLMSLPSFEKKINEEADRRFQIEYEKLKHENSELINKNVYLKTKLTELKSDIQMKESQLSGIKSDFNNYIKFMSNKKDSIESDILDYYFQQLINNHLYVQKQTQNGYIMDKRQEESFEIIKTIENARKAFKYNLKQVSERDLGDFMLDYILINLKFNQPLFIVGAYSYKLADLILKTFSSAESRTIIPDTSDFNLNELYNENRRNCKKITFTHVHNIHISSASLNLTGFLNVYELLDNENNMIFTFDSFEESRFLLEQLRNYSILDVSNKTFSPSPFKKREDFKLGQINTEILHDLQPTIEFEESLERLTEPDEISPDLEQELNQSLKKVVYMNQILDNRKKVLKYFPHLQSNQIGEVDD